ncbi:unnamed protein product [Lactuca saligna]|uniref:Uncharacterized protein n=1 Tax=Lactuca saligna TaxID=75948 RepID=A0AA35Z609_LACSI|nr:unnamed protein product [Lactuca saligna]
MDSSYVIVSGVLNIALVLFSYKGTYLSPFFTLPFILLHFPFFCPMTSPPGIVPSATEYQHLESTYGLSSLDGVEFPSPGSSIMSPPLGKVGIYQKTLDAGLRLPLTKFQDEVLPKDGCSIQMLTPNVVNKVVAFEMICRAND